METNIKHKNLLNFLKLSYKNDEIGDKELINKTITEFFVVEEYNGNNTIRRDKTKKTKDRFSLVVKTKMFGWRAKHLDRNIAINIWKEIYNLT